MPSKSPDRYFVSVGYWLSMPRKPLIDFLLQSGIGMSLPAKPRRGDVFTTHGVSRGEVKPSPYRDEPRSGEVTGKRQHRPPVKKRDKFIKTYKHFDKLKNNCNFANTFGA